MSQLYNVFEMSQPGRTRRHTVNIFKPRARLLTRQRFFSIRMIDQWNGLPQTAKTVPQFKAKLDLHRNSLVYRNQQRRMTNPLIYKCKCKRECSEEITKNKRSNMFFEV